MNYKIKSKLPGALALLLTSVLMACSGGGGGGGSTTTNNNTSGSQIKLGGVVAAGAPVVGSMAAKDSTGKVFGPVKIGTDGSYSLDITGGAAPFILQASGVVGASSMEIYSVAADTTATNINITPLTNVVVAQATGSSPASIFSGCSSSSCSTPGKTQVELGRQQAQAYLQDLMTTCGVTGTVNVLTDTMVVGPVANQSALDKMLDMVSIKPSSVNPASFVVTPTQTLIDAGVPPSTVLVSIPAAATGGVTTVQNTALTVDTSLNTTVVNNATTALTTMQSIQAQFDIMTGLFATAKPNATDPAFVALFDTANWLDWGNNWATWSANMTGATTGASVGAKFVNAVATSPRYNLSTPIPNDATHQWILFTYKDPSGYTGLNGPLLAIKNGSTWQFAGSQMPAPNFAGTATSSTNITGWTHTERNVITMTGSTGTLDLSHLYTSSSSATQGKFYGTGLAVTVDPNEPMHATFTGSITLDNDFGGAGSNARTTTATGNMYINERNGTVDIYWTAPDPLLGGTVGGCSTTSTQVKECSGPVVPPADLVGTWKVTLDGSGNPLTGDVSIVFLADGRFMLLEAGTACGSTGAMESGYYSVSGGVITLNITYDTSTTCGLWQGAAPTVYKPATMANVTLNTSTGVLIDNGVTKATLAKQAATSTEVGTWLFKPSSGGTFSILINQPGGKFVYAEAPSLVFPDPVANGRGMEVGTYSVGTGTYTFTAVTFDGNGTTSGVNAAVGTAMPLASIDTNHIVITAPGPVNLPMARQ